MKHVVLAGVFLGLISIGTLARSEDPDYVVTSGKLDQDEFYALISCHAEPGEQCTSRPVRWSAESARDLRVGLAPVPPEYPPALARVMDRALQSAIDEVNSVGAALHLSRATKGTTAPVMVHLSPATEGEPIRGTGVAGVDGVPIGAALVTVWWDENNEITEALIVMAADLPAAEALPVMLEELTQGLGLLTDIRNPYYNSISVFSEDSNSVAKLGVQDRAAIRQHYPHQ